MIKIQKKFVTCLFWIALCLILSGFAGWVTGNNIDSWYVYLQKPSFNPPSWVFGPVWTVLYIMIGISGGLLWAGRSKMRLPFAFYLLQLIANFIWSFLFFGFHQIGWAFVDIVLLVVFIMLTIISSYKRSKRVSYLLVPYLLWVLFAGVLNFSLWQLN